MWFQVPVLGVILRGGWHLNPRTFFFGFFIPAEPSCVTLSHYASVLPCGVWPLPGFDLRNQDRGRPASGHGLFLFVFFWCSLFRSHCLIGCLGCFFFFIPLLSRCWTGVVSVCLDRVGGVGDGRLAKPRAALLFDGCIYDMRLWACDDMICVCRLLICDTLALMLLGREEGVG